MNTVGLDAILFFGLVNWIATTIVVESEVTRPLRDWLGIRQYATTAELLKSNRRTRVRLTAYRKLRYLIGCHLCSGTWVGLAQAAILGSPWAGLSGWIAGGLAYKAIGHLVLELRPQAWVGRVNK